jgi:probable addiction module antidote protein
MTQNFTRYHDWLIQSLKDQEEALAYLTASLIDEEEPNLFTLALKNVLEAQGLDLSTLAQKTGIKREKLVRSLSLKGNPSLTTILAILKAMGLCLKIEAVAGVPAKVPARAAVKKKKPAQKPARKPTRTPTPRPTPSRPGRQIGRIAKTAKAARKK